VPGLSTRIDLLRGLWNGERALTGPFFVTVDATSRCNLRCVGCPFHSLDSRDPKEHRPVRDLDPVLFGRLCDDVTDMNTELIVFSGEGEPLLHPQLFELLRLAKSAVPEVLLLTNGTLLTPKTAEALIESRVDRIRVSLWAGSKAEYEANYPGTDGRYFDRVVDGLRNLSAAKQRLGKTHPRVSVHNVLNRNNYRGLRAFADLVIDSGADAMSFMPMRPVPGKPSSLALSKAEAPSLRASLLEIQPLVRSAGLGENIDETLLYLDVGANVCREVPCYIGWMHARVKLDGKVRPCSQSDHEAGDLNEKSFREIWNDTALRRFRQQTLAFDEEFRNGEFCDCNYCCHISQNLKVDRVFKWFKPFVGR